MTEERPSAPDGDRLAGLDRPLRNRVTPAGELIATEHRRTMYGNRGVLPTLAGASTVARA